MKVKKIIFTLIISPTLYLNAQYSTPGTGVKWTLDSIALHSPTTITISDDIYFVNKNFEVSEADSLLLEKNMTVKIAANIEIGIKGYFKSNADYILITAQNYDEPYKGFWFYESSNIYFRNTTIERGGGLKVVSPKFIMYHCDVSNNIEGSSTGAAISFSNGSPVIKNSTFKNNQKPALSSAANATVSATIENSYFEKNHTDNGNAPQINMGPSGPDKTTLIKNNTIIGDRSFDKVGGISASSLLGTPNNVMIIGNRVENNRYGITVMGGEGEISNNILENNNTETNPMNGGSGIALYNTANMILTGNEVRYNLWGITLISTNDTPMNINLGSDDENDLNPGGNIFKDNVNNGKTYALYNNTSYNVKGIHNCWREGELSTPNQVENVINHKPDDSTLGRVIFKPFDCGVPMDVDDQISQSAFTVYPNPSTGKFQIESKEKGSVKIFSIEGKLIHQTTIDAGKNFIQVTLPKGVYLLELNSQKFKTTEKLLIK